MRSREIFTTYLALINATHASGQATPETSYYPALANLLNAIGNDLKPRVHCVINPQNRGAGIPDGGLFTHDQLSAQPLSDKWPAPNPARGVIEAKPPHHDLDKIAASEQVARYAQTYGQVLVTNFREFLLVGLDNTGALTHGERFSLAPSEDAFWQLAAFPRTAPELEAERFAQFLERVLRHNAPLNDPRDVAWFLASYAREARARIEHTGLAGLTTIKTALEDALGLHFDTARGEHFFRSTLVQTLFYGIFSAWVLWSKSAKGKDAKFDWHDAMWTLHVPAIKVLYEQIATRSRLEPLNLVEVLNWAGDALNRVNRDLFFQKFAEEHAIQYFYEPFLEAFDPDLRKELGVWYTPHEVVSYMVSRVDAILRDQLGRPDGLADPDVYVLDPCTGTGSYPLAILRRIYQTLTAKGADALLAAELKRAAMQRIFGFEILPAPFVVAHLQIGLLLQSFGAPLSDKHHERAAVYLTNALTGWESGEKQTPLPLPELQAERDAAAKIKIRRPILVVIGNPPYNGYAGVAVDEERDLSDAYRQAINVKQPQGQGLNDLYVRFYRMAERRIVDMTGEGIVCFISNYSWLDGLSFTAMRERYLNEFDHIWIDSLNGDKYKTGKLTPDGKPDPSVFSTEHNREGIQVGTAIALLLREKRHNPATSVEFRHLWGKTKRQTLLDTAVQPDNRLYQTVTPEPDLGLPFIPMTTEAAYLTWPLLTDLLPTFFPGVTTSRDDLVVDTNRDRLISRMKRYFDPNISNAEMRRTVPSAMGSTRQFDAESVRAYLQARGFLPNNIVKYCYRPFDERWLYWEPETKLLDRNRSELFTEAVPGNVFLVTTARTRKSLPEPALVTSQLCDYNSMDSGARAFPLFLTSPQAIQLSGLEQEERRPNLTASARHYLISLASSDDAVFLHCIAVIHSPSYREENAGPLRHDWPRIPLPASHDRLSMSSELGKRIVHLQDFSARTPGIDTGAIRPELRTIAVVSSADGLPLDPSTGALALTAGWGYSGTRGAIMPGHGRAIERAYTPDEQSALAAWRNPLGLDLTAAIPLLGETTFDIYLNDRAYWRNIPRHVWTYTMGGYPVLKKWLSYREQPVLGRPLTLDDVRLFQTIARRIAALLLLAPQLDANYRAVTADPFDWSTATQPTANTLSLW